MEFTTAIGNPTDSIYASRPHLGTQDRTLSTHADTVGAALTAGNGTTITYDMIRQAADMLNGNVDRYRGYRPQRALTTFNAVVRVDAEYTPPLEAIQEQAAAQLAKDLLPYLHCDTQHGPSAEDPYSRTINYRFSISAEVSPKPVDNYLAEIDKLVDEITTLKQKLAKYENETELPRL